MKKIFGVILLILALISAVNSFNKLSKAGPRNTGNRSYDTGHVAGMITAPLLLGGVGLWLLLSSRNFSLPKPVTKSLRWTALAVAGVTVAAVIFVAVVGKARRTARNSSYPPNISSPTSSQPFGSASASHANPQSSFSPGQEVEANWAGKWMLGKITRANPGGFSFLVQLEDSHFPHPIVLSTNQLRVKSH